MPKRVDRNQPEIVAALRSQGLSVLHLHEVGKGCPDLCVGFNGNNYLVEIKDGKKPPSAQKLTEAEKIFKENWKGNFYIINSVDMAMQFVKFIGVAPVQ